MIVKSFELNKIDLSNKYFFLLYGENQGHKNELIEKKFKKNLKNVYNYEESEILNNEEDFFNSIFTKSFFESEKLIIISRASDRIKSTIEEKKKKKVEDLTIVLKANILEKKSKLRALFEKNKETICVAFYEDNHQTLMTIANNFFRDNKILISQQTINLIIERSRGDRQNLNNELEKVQSFIKNKTRIEIKDILKITNLAENYDVSELIDNCLAKNRKKTFNILNENNYTLEDCILIIRTFLIKSKRLLKLYQKLEDKNNINDVITSFKPPIFWKDKDIVKQQIKNWTYSSIEKLIFKINEIELLIKKNSHNAVNILSDFIIDQTIRSSN